MPYGGGGLSCGIASALRALAPSCKVFAAEVATAAPLAASLEAGEPVKVEYTPSFVDGIGGRRCSRRCSSWRGSSWTARSSQASRRSTDAVRLLAERNRVVAEGAGATPVAARARRSRRHGKVVCVVSGGNIDSAKLAEILGS